jgi:hypothetical protein
MKARRECQPVTLDVLSIRCRAMFDFLGPPRGLKSDMRDKRPLGEHSGSSQQRGE